MSISGSRLYGGPVGRFYRALGGRDRGVESVLQKAPVPGFANEFDNKVMSHVDGGMQHMMFPDRLILLTATHASANHS